MRKCNNRGCGGLGATHHVSRLNDWWFCDPRDAEFQRFVKARQRGMDEWTALLSAKGLTLPPPTEPETPPDTGLPN
jgi:hypothetical protein